MPQSDLHQPKVVVVLDLDLTLILHPDDLGINLKETSWNFIYRYFEQLGLNFGTDIVFDPLLLLFVLHPTLAKNFFKFLFSKQHKDYIEIVILTNGEYNEKMIKQLLARNYCLDLREFLHVKFYNKFSLGGAGITKADKISKIVSSDDHVVLIDDLIINCMQAKRLGYWVIQANLGRSDFFDKARTLVRELLLGVKYELEAKATTENSDPRKKPKKSSKFRFFC